MTQRSGRHYRGAGMVAVCILLGGSALAVGQIRIGVGIAVPGVRIGINVPTYPQLVPVPGYPVYYAPALSENLFFYDGLYWVLAGDDWYYSSWYDGPWYLAQPELVPDFILRIPILYYRRPPAYFLHWNRAAPPRWGEHWGRAWEERRHGWDRWNRAAVPPRAPLPSYQRQYPRGRYPGADRQQNLENRFYRYTPRDAGDRARLQQAPARSGPRIAPQPNPQTRERRRPEAPPNAYRSQPGAMQRPGARPPQERGRPAPQGRQENRNPKQQPAGDERRGHRPPG
jgi:hypothetical protein